MKVSNVHKQLIDQEVEDAKNVQDDNGDFADYDQEVQEREAQRTAERTVRAKQRDLEQRLLSDLPKSKKHRDANRRTRGESKAAGLTDELGLVLDAFLFDVIDHDVRAIRKPLHLAVTNILQAGLTTTYALALLLKNGNVVDADARWRGLYELTCQAAVLSRASNSEEAALRYLMHGQKDFAKSRLNDLDGRKGEDIVRKELLRGKNKWGNHIWEDSYQWIPAELLKGGMQQEQISQRQLFEMADLQAAPRSLVKDSHKSVHMSSLVVAAESTVALDNEPGGYDLALEEDIAERTARTLYELVAHCCLLAANLPTGNSYPAWEQEFYERVRLTVKHLTEARHL